MKAIAIVGRKNSGKTQLILRVIPELSARGLRVSTVKNAHHHNLEFDHPGKDSYLHRAAGATEILVVSDDEWAIVGRHAPRPSLQDLLRKLSPCDLVLVEGYKSEISLPRIEVWRPAASCTAESHAAPLAVEDAGIVAVACPRSAPRVDMGALRLDLDDTQAISSFLLEIANSLLPLTRHSTRTPALA